MSTAPLSAIAAEYLRTVNDHDPAGFIAIFADDAVVNDAGREFLGVETIRQWSESDIFAANVSLELLSESTDGDTTALTTKVDGDFDRTGLPDPLIMVQRLTLAGNKITQLTCQLAD